MSSVPEAISRAVADSTEPLVLQAGGAQEMDEYVIGGQRAHDAISLEAS